MWTNCHQQVFFVMPVLEFTKSATPVSSPRVQTYHFDSLSKGRCQIMKPRGSATLQPTCVQTYPQFEFVFRAMSDLEGLDAIEESQRHPGDLSRVTLAVHDR